MVNLSKMKSINLAILTTILMIWLIFFYSLSFGSDIKLGASFFFHNNQFDKAITFCLKAVNDGRENDSELHYEIGLSYFLKGDLQNALKFWNTAKLLKGRTL